MWHSDVDILNTTDVCTLGRLCMMESGLWYRPVAPSAQEDEAGASQATVQIEFKTIRQLSETLSQNFKKTAGDTAPRQGTCLVCGRPRGPLSRPEKDRRK